MIERKSLIVWAVIFAVVPFVFTSAYHLQQISQILIFLLFFLGVDLAVGHGGLISVCHGALFGIGAYATGILTTDYEFGYWASVVVGMFIAGGTGLIIGVLTLKLEGHYFVIGTLAFALLITSLASNLDITHGELGITNIPGPDFSLFPGSFERIIKFYFLIYMVVLIGAGIYIWISRSIFGRQLRAIRDNPLLADAMGVDVSRTKIVVFIISSAISALAGSLQAAYLTYISPQITHYSIGFLALLALIVGGRGLLGGALVGTLIFSALPELLRGAREYQMVILGVLIILIIQRLPDGIYAWLLRSVCRLRSLN